MFAIKDFIEIQVIGFLLLLGVLPLIILFNPSLRNKDGFFAQLDEINDKPTKAVLLIVLAFSLGVAANRIFDDVLDPIGIDPGSQYKAVLESWAESNKPNVKSLKMAELALSERSEVERGWLERHKLFDRIDRGAAISFILLLVSMAVYEATKKCFRITKPRYYLRHFVVTFLLASVFFLAYWLESSSYKEHVCDSFTQSSCKQTLKK